MTTTIVPRPAVASRLVHWRNVPERIGGLTALIVLSAIALGATLAVIFGSVASGVRTIGGQSAPEVSASTDLYFRLNDMDAQIANILLVGAQHNLGLDQAQAQATYQADRTSADRDLEQAAAVAGTSQAAQRAIRSVLDKLGSYEDLVGQINYIEGTGPGRPGRPPAAALALYRTATDLLQGGILPSARNLTTANASVLAATYHAKRSQAITGIVVVLVVGLALIALLVGAQLYISATHRRLLNPALAAATLVAVIVTAAGSTLLAA